MPRRLFVDPDPRVGSDANSGLSEKRPKLTLQGALALDPRPGDSVLVRMDATLTVPAVLKTNGVTYGIYSLGTERNRAPTIAIPKVGDLPNGTAITIRGSDNEINGWDIRDADMGVLADPGEMVNGKPVSYSGNRIIDVRVFNFALAVCIKGTQAICERVAVFGGRMLRNAAITYVGANAFTVWKHPDYPNSGTQLIRCHAEDCFAYTPASKQPDGSAIEIFGGVEDLRIEWMTTREIATFCEMGATPSRHETISGVTFDHCTVIHPNGRVLYINDHDGAFGLNFERIVVNECTFIADDAPASPFFIGAGHGNLSQKLSVRNCVITGASQTFNAAAGTDITSVDRGGNVYGGSKTAGLPLINGDVLRDPHFHNPAASDYRLSHSDPRGATLGALGTGPGLKEVYSKTPLIEDAATTRGGHHCVDTWQHMIEILDRYRVAGMTCTVEHLRRTYQLQPDKVTWLVCD